jgi:protein CpxP
MTMKSWIKRTLIGLFAAGALLGGLAACSHGMHRHGWHAMSDADMAQMKTRMVDRVGSKLDLDEAQKAKLGVLADQMQAQRKAFIGNGPEPRAELQSLIAGATFDRAKASHADRRQGGRGAEPVAGRAGGAGRLLRQPQARTAGQGA